MYAMYIAKLLDKICNVQVNWMCSFTRKKRLRDSYLFKPLNYIFLAPEPRLDGKEVATWSEAWCSVSVRRHCPTSWTHLTTVMSASIVLAPFDLRSSKHHVATGCARAASKKCFSVKNPSSVQGGRKTVKHWHEIRFLSIFFLNNF